MKHSPMLSPPVTGGLPQWEVLPHCYYRHQGSDDDGPRPVMGPELGKETEGLPVPKVYTRKRGPNVEKSDVGPSGEDGRIIVSTKVCAECHTSKTPLWRNGPAGPKSLCNACGIRYRKRCRTRFAVVDVDNAVFIKERPRHGRGLFVLERSLFGTEEARAAEMLMALSCDSSLNASA